MTFERILAIKLRHIGDNLLALPALRALKRAYPRARLDYLVSEYGGAELLRAQTAIDEVLVYPKERSLRFELARRLRAEPYDLAIDFSWDSRSALWGVLSGADVRAGYYLRKKIPTWLYYTRAIPIGQDHTAETNLDLANLVMPGDAQAAEPTGAWLDVPDRARADAERILRELGVDAANLLVTHPSSRWKFKCWTAAGNAAFIDRLERETGLTPLLTYGPDPIEREQINAIVRLCAKPPAVLPAPLDLVTYAAILQKARMVLAVDSAAVHIASGLGVPVVALFGPSGQKEWRPWRVPYRTIQRLEWDCCPCGQDGCAGTKISRCLDDIRPEEVLGVVQSLLKIAKVKKI